MRGLLYPLLHSICVSDQLPAHSKLRFRCQFSKSTCHAPPKQATLLPRRWLRWWRTLKVVFVSRIGIVGRATGNVAAMMAQCRDRGQMSIPEPPLNLDRMLGQNTSTDRSSHQRYPRIRRESRGSNSHIKKAILCPLLLRGNFCLSTPVT